jgi:hypothetical protein
MKRSLLGLASLFVTAPALAAPPAEDDRCELRVEGDVTATALSAGGRMMVGTDYWLDEDARRKALSATIKDPAKLEAALHKDPVFYILTMTCGDESNKVTLMASGASKYADFAFGPGRHAIHDAFKAKAGEATAMAKAGGERYGSVDGTLDISRWDTSGIAGTFQITSSRTDFKTKVTKNVTVHGTFKLKR